NQVTSVTQFSDVRPTDWAYQALSALVEKYGCVAGYPNGTFKGGQALSRYEAAALLNACLDRVTEVTDELRRLQKEFEQELAVLKGRVDGLEAKVGKLEAAQFSTTTKLQGEATFVLGGSSFNYSGTKPEAKYTNGGFGATTLNYDVRLNLSTSFTGKDLLYTRLRAGNFANNAFNGSSSFNLQRLDTASSASVSNGTSNVNNNDLVFIDRLYYRFPLNSEFTAFLGAKARNTEFLAIQPSYYNAGILDAFTTHGAPGTYNKATGATVGAIWKQTVKKGQPYFGAALNYVAVNGANGNPGPVNAANTGGGLFGDYSQANLTAQFGVAAPQWALAVAYRYGSCGQAESRNGTTMASGSLSCVAPLSQQFSNAASSSNVALTAAWQPAKGGTWIPSVSAGWGYSSITNSPATAIIPNTTSNVSESQSWTIALQWTDAFVKGNAAGFAFGQPSFATALVNGATPNDAGYAFEWWYRFQVTDKISVTPAIYYLSNPGGQNITGTLTNGTPPVNAGDTSSVFGALIQTRFKF
ncbi:MAG: iron uptake porin, partial [Cyanobacteriota bacterium]